MKRGAVEQILLLGDKKLGQRWEPLLRAKAIVFEKNLTEGAHLSKRVHFPDGWCLMKLTKGRRKLIIYCESGGIEYEFFTSNVIDDAVMGTPPFIGTNGYGYSVCGGGSKHQLTAKTAESKPLVELCIGCSDTPEGEDPETPWPKEDCETNEGLQFMTHEDAWDFKKCHIQMHWPNNNGNSFVVSQADVDPYYSRRMMQSYHNGAVLLRPFEYISDGSKHPFAYTYDGSLLNNLSPDVPVGRKRRKAVLINRDGHSVMVMVDNKGTFYCWDAGLYANASEIPRVESVTPAYDVRIEDGLGTFNFNSNGTKAVAVAIEREQSPQDDSGNTIYKETYGQHEDNDYGFGYKYTASNSHLAKEDHPHLVEVQITIGTDFAGDWTFSVSVIRSERYKDTGNWFVAADYLVGDDRLPYPEDTLVALRFEMQYDSSKGLWLGGTHYPDDISMIMNACMRSIAYVGNEWLKITQYRLYGGVKVTERAIIIYKDQFGNNLRTWSSAPEDIGGGGYYPLYSGLIRSMNLRTLSFLFLKEQINNLTSSGVNQARSYRTEVYAYDQLEAIEQYVDVSQGPVTFDYEWGGLGSAWLDVPAGYLSLYGNYAENMFQSSWLNQFSWHPKGHWAVCHYNYPLYDIENPIPNWQMDIVNVRSGQSDGRFTHQELFNQAFNANRDYTYYNDSSFYRGVFRTAGIWRDR